MSKTPFNDLPPNTKLELGDSSGPQPGPKRWEVMTWDHSEGTNSYYHDTLADAWAMFQILREQDNHDELYLQDTHGYAFGHGYPHGLGCVPSPLRSAKRAVKG